MTKNKLNIGTILFYWNYYFSEEFKENIVFLLEVNLVNQCSKFGIPSRSFFWNFSFILLANLFKVRSVEWIFDFRNKGRLNLLGGQTLPVKSLEPAMFSDITNTWLLIANSFRWILSTQRFNQWLGFSRNFFSVKLNTNKGLNLNLFCLSYLWIPFKIPS